MNSYILISNMELFLLYYVYQFIHQTVCSAIYVVYFCFTTDGGILVQIVHVNMVASASSFGFNRVFKKYISLVI